MFWVGFNIDNWSTERKVQRRNIGVGAQVSRWIFRGLRLRSIIIWHLCDFTLNQFTRNTLTTPLGIHTDSIYPNHIPYLMRFLKWEYANTPMTGLSRSTTITGGNWGVIKIGDFRIRSLKFKIQPFALEKSFELLPLWWVLFTLSKYDSLHLKFLFKYSYCVGVCWI